MPILSDVVAACEAIAVTLKGVELPEYEATRTLRSAVEREFTIIGEAINRLSTIDPELAARISHARMIVGFRNQTRARLPCHHRRDGLGDRKERSPHPAR